MAENIITLCQNRMGLFGHFRWREKLIRPILALFAFINVKDTEKPRQCWHTTEVSHSPAPHTQTSFSLGSPAACTHSPATPPESAASWFPPECLPVEVENTHHDDYRDQHMHGSKEECFLWYSTIWGFSCYGIIFLQREHWSWLVLY